MAHDTAECEKVLNSVMKGTFPWKTRKKTDHISNCVCVCVCVFFFYPMPHMSLTDFVVFPPGHGRSVTDFSGWDAHEASYVVPLM